ncbi:hypothetical protein CBR55_32085 [Bacillus thuringiensis]|nr:hypothetical protein CBR55_32085 [Bacillus thuringiensis]
MTTIALAKTTGTTPAQTRTAQPRTTSGLGNTEIEVNTSKEPQVNEGSKVTRARAWRRQNVMYKITNSKALAGCHRWRRDEAVAVSWSSNGASQFEGLQNSHSRWGSPLAELEVMGERRIELAIATKNHLAAGGALMMFVGTVRHNRSQSFAQVEAGIKTAYSSMVKTSQWKKERARYGVEHTYSDYEVTDSWANGWHLHRNMLLFLDRPLSDDELKAFEDSMFSRWSAGVVKAGMDAPLREHGVKLDQVSTWGGDAAKMATYLAKGMSQELTGSATKTASKGSYTPFQMLDMLADQSDAGEDMDAVLVARWREYEVGSKNLRSSWSRGAKRALGIDYIDADVRREMEEELYKLAGLEAPERVESTRVAVALVKPDDWKLIQSDFAVRQYVLDCVDKAKDVAAAQRVANEVLASLGVDSTPCMIVMDDVDLDAVLPTHGDATKRDLNAAVFAGNEQTIFRTH